MHNIGPLGFPLDGAERRCWEPKCAPTEGESSKLSVCKSCGVARYCSRTCQTSHWRVHKLTCKGLAQLRDAQRSAVKPISLAVQVQPYDETRMGLLASEHHADAQWHFWKFEKPENCKLLLQQQVGRLTKASWKRFVEHSENAKVMHQMWQLAHTKDGLLFTVAAEPPVPSANVADVASCPRGVDARSGSAQGDQIVRLIARPTTNAITNKLKERLADMAGSLDMGLVLMRQPSKHHRENCRQFGVEHAVVYEVLTRACVLQRWSSS